MMLSSDLNVERFGGYAITLPPDSPLPKPSLASPTSVIVMPRGMNAPKLWPAEPVNVILIVSSGRPGGAVFPRHLRPEHRPDGAIGVADEGVDLHRHPVLERRPALRNQVVVERDVEAVVLRADAAARDAGGQIRHVEERPQVEAVRLPVMHRGLDVEAVGAADHLVERAEAELRHDLAHFLREKAEEVLDELRLARELASAAPDPASRCRPGRCSDGRRASSRSP